MPVPPDYFWRRLNVTRHMLRRPGFVLDSCPMSARRGLMILALVQEVIKCTERSEEHYLPYIPIEQLSKTVGSPENYKSALSRHHFDSSRLPQ